MTIFITLFYVGIQRLVQKLQAIRKAAQATPAAQEEGAA